MTDQLPRALPLAEALRYQPQVEVAKDDEHETQAEIARSVAMDDGLSFSLWHALADHRPLESICRARRVAYPSSVSARSPRGRCPVHEPKAAE